MLIRVWLNHAIRCYENHRIEVVHFRKYSKWRVCLQTVFLYATKSMHQVRCRRCRPQHQASHQTARRANRPVAPCQCQQGGLHQPSKSIACSGSASAVCRFAHWSVCGWHTLPTDNYPRLGQFAGVGYWQVNARSKASQECGLRNSIADCLLFCSQQGSFWLEFFCGRCSS